MKALILWIVIFCAVGLGVEHYLNLPEGVEGPTADELQQQTVDTFTAARRGGDVIVQDPAPRGYTQPQLNGISQCNAPQMGAPYAQSPMPATVLRVIDGDTLAVSVEGIEMSIRLWGIDAPEMGQHGGPDAQAALATINPAGTPVLIHPMSTDQYGRIVGTVGSASELSANFEMVLQGWAYHHPEFSSRDNRCLLEAEKLAKSQRRGVWISGPGGQMRPWEFRRQAKLKRHRA